MQHIIEIRDFLYIHIKEKSGEQYVMMQLKISMMLTFLMYYMTLVSLIAILQYKSNIPVPPILKGNIIVDFIGGLIMFTPYYFFIRFILRKISVVPIKENLSLVENNRIRSKVFTIVSIGFILMFLVPWAADRLLPFF